MIGCSPASSRHHFSRLCPVCVDQVIQPAARRAMNQQKPQKPAPPMMEYWFVIGIALSASGMFYNLLFIAVLYLLFRHQRPDAAFELLTVTSLLVGMALSDIFKMALSPELNSVHRYWEPAGVIAATLALFYTEKRGWSWLLISYSAVMVAFKIWAAAKHLPRGVRPQFQIVHAGIFFLVLWLLAIWLRKRTPLPSTYPETNSSEKENASHQGPSVKR
ncbi:MAG TPA: hypothetical protein VMB80_06385 [Candidatus Acidoferrum sp.]|nr:hypothetical protein [Candidatus Acidoferrum sp.]